MKKHFFAIFIILALTAVSFSCGGGGGGGGVYDTSSTENSTTPAANPATTPTDPVVFNSNEIDISQLSAYLASKPVNAVSNAYPIKVSGITTSNYTDIPTALKANPTKYADLSLTTLPDGITNMQEYFKDCKTLVQ